jgi:hypothetical protein
MRQYHFFFRATTGREQHLDRLTDHFRSGITEDLFGPFVPTCNRAVDVLADDGVVGGFYEGSQAIAGLVEPLALRDIPQDHGVKLPLRCFELRDRSFYWELFAVGTQTEDRTQRPHRALGHVRLAKSADVPPVGGTEALGQEAVERLPNGFPGWAEKHPFRRPIEANNVLRLVYGDDGVHCRIDYARHLLITPSHRLFGPRAARESAPDREKGKSHEPNGEHAARNDYSLGNEGALASPSGALYQDGLLSFSHFLDEQTNPIVQLPLLDSGDRDTRRFRTLGFLRKHLRATQREPVEK